VDLLDGRTIQLQLILLGNSHCWGTSLRRRFARRKPNGLVFTVFSRKTFKSSTPTACEFPDFFRYQTLSRQARAKFSDSARNTTGNSRKNEKQI
ncbi:MAG: hypothetical protein U9N87_11940, partial [Planctomycetota bacterium]|nr:hypothetical protein [Planctomycetota bacterium]